MEPKIAKYTYYYRPGFRSANLLIEFLTGINRSEGHAGFIADLLEALSSLDCKMGNIEDVFANDEYVVTLHTSSGIVQLSIDIWDMAFIMAEDNQPALVEINKLLQEDVRFKRVEVDFEKYK